LSKKAPNLRAVSTAYINLNVQMFNKNASIASPAVLKEQVSEFCSRFGGCDQQDSHEFLIVLLDALCQDLCSNDSNGESSTDFSIVHSKIKSTVKCLECKQEIPTYELFASLPLPILPALSIQYKKEDGMWKYFRYISCVLNYCLNSPMTVETCLDLLTKTEILSENGQWYCNICGHLTDAEKKLDLWTLPKILILQLKRFTYDLSNNNKINTFVNYPLRNLDLSDYVINHDYDQTTRYDLVAVSTHNGSLAGGHYTAFAKNFDTQQWYYFNDENVRTATENEIITTDAYILVYIQQTFISNEVD
jgi:ubiquitin C-terminal hydrolase